MDTVFNDKTIAELYLVEPKAEEDRSEPSVIEDIDFKYELHFSQVEQLADFQYTSVPQGNNKTKALKPEEVLFECEHCPYKTR